MKVIIDRFENEYSIVELDSGEVVNLPTSLLPEGAKEGDVIEIKIDVEATKERKKMIKKLMDGLWA